MKCPIRNDGKGRFGECMGGSCAWCVREEREDGGMTYACAVAFMAYEASPKKRFFKIMGRE